MATITIQPADKLAIRHTIDVLKRSKSQHEHNARIAKVNKYGSAAVDDHLGRAAQDQGAIALLEELLK